METRSALIATLRPTESLVAGIGAREALLGSLGHLANISSSLQGLGIVISTGVDEDMVINKIFEVTVEGTMFTVPHTPGDFTTGDYTIVAGMGTVPGNYGLPRMPHADRTAANFKVYFTGIVAVGTKIDFHCKEVV